MAALGGPESSGRSLPTPGRAPDLVRAGCRGALAAAPGVLAVLGAMGAARGVAGWETAVARRAYDLPGATTPVFEAVMQIGTRPVVVGAALLVGAARGARAGVAVGVAGAGAWALAAAGKALELRDRPTAIELGRTIRTHVEGSGYPSSHAAIAVGIVAATLFVWRLRAVTATVLVAAAATTALARVHLGVHWPLDVVGGAAIGVFAASVAVLAVDRRPPP